MKKVLVLALLICICMPAAAWGETNIFLDTAFITLEKGNPILDAYNTYNGGNVEARFEYGLPYLFGGRKESLWLSVRRPDQESNYYKKNKKYLHGLDCSGYVRWVYEKVGLERPVPASSMKSKANQKHLVDMEGIAYSKWHEKLQIGDLITLSSSSYHIMMYIGTLSSFGYTEETVSSELKPYLDYPLAIHSGMNNFHTQWYTKYIQDNNLKCTPPDGGVTISLVGVAFDEAPFHQTMWENTSNEKTFHYFDLDGYNLTCYDLEKYRWWVVYRQ